MTIFPTGVSYISSFQSTSNSIGAGGSVSLFQASSVANEITYLSAKIAGLDTASNTYLVIGPATGTNPTNNDGYIRISQALIYRNNSNDYGNSSLTNDDIYQAGNISWSIDSAGRTFVIIDSLIIQPSYFVYLRSGSGTTVAYNVQQITVKQS